MINKSKLYFSTILGCSLLTASAFAGDISMNTARLQAMDKITGKVSELIVPVNGLANFGSFSILVRKCVTKPVDEVPEDTAFIDVVDNYNSADPINIFKGWMFSSTPALNAVEHPIYDIWLLQCFNQKNDNKKILTEEQLALRDTIPMQRQEKIEISTTLTEQQPDESTSSSEQNQEVILENSEEDEQFASEGEEFTENEVESSAQTPNDEQSVIIIKE